MRATSINRLQLLVGVQPSGCVVVGRLDATHVFHFFKTRDFA
jgi:hypothetical protein